MWGSTEAEAFKPTWSDLKGYDDHVDDVRMNGEWGGTQERHDRREHDKKLGKDGSPPPKGMGRKTSTKSSRTSKEQLWGREWGEDTTDFNAPYSIAENEDSCQEEHACKFKAGGKGEGEHTTVPA